MTHSPSETSSRAGSDSAYRAALAHARLALSEMTKEQEALLAEYADLTLRCRRLAWLILCLARLLDLPCDEEEQQYKSLCDEQRARERGSRRRRTSAEAIA